jgi:hypothetical protein
MPKQVPGNIGGCEEIPWLYQISYIIFTAGLNNVLEFVEQGFWVTVCPVPGYSTA